MNSSRRWLIVGGYAASLPFLRSVWDLFTLRFGIPGRYFSSLITAALLSALVWYLAAVKAEKRAWTYVALALISVPAWWIFRAQSQPVVRLHLAEYVLLGMMVFWAMSDGRGDDSYMLSPL